MYELPSPLRVKSHIEACHAVSAPPAVDTLAPSVIIRSCQPHLEVGCTELGPIRENGYIESFNGKLRDELLNGEIFYTLLEAKVLIERWRQHYNRIRPHSSLGYRPPAPEVVTVAQPAGSATLGTLATLRPPAGIVDTKRLT